MSGGVSLAVCGTKAAGKACSLANPYRPGHFLSQTSRGTAMLVFQIVGTVFVLLFLAAAMTGIEGTRGH